MIDIHVQIGLISSWKYTGKGYRHIFANNWITESSNSWGYKTLKRIQSHLTAQEAKLFAPGQSQSSSWKSWKGSLGFLTPNPQCLPQASGGDADIISKEELVKRVRKSIQYYVHTNHHSKIKALPCYTNQNNVRNSSPLSDVAECQREQAEVSLVIRIKLITFETVREWYRPKSNYGKSLQWRGENWRQLCKD